MYELMREGKEKLPKESMNLNESGLGRRSGDRDEMSKATSSGTQVWI